MFGLEFQSTNKNEVSYLKNMFRSKYCCIKMYQKNKEKEKRKKEITDVYVNYVYILLHVFISR